MDNVNIKKKDHETLEEGLMLRAMKEGKLDINPSSFEDLKMKQAAEALRLRAMKEGKLDIKPSSFEDPEMKQAAEALRLRAMKDSFSKSEFQTELDTMKCADDIYSLYERAHPEFDKDYNLEDEEKINLIDQYKKALTAASPEVKREFGKKLEKMDHAKSEAKRAGDNIYYLYLRYDEDEGSAFEELLMNSSPLAVKYCLKRIHEDSHAFVLNSLLVRSRCRLNSDNPEVKKIAENDYSLLSKFTPVYVQKFQDRLYSLTVGLLAYNLGNGNSTDRSELVENVISTLEEQYGVSLTSERRPENPEVKPNSPKPQMSL